MKSSRTLVGGGEGWFFFSFLYLHFCRTLGGFPHYVLWTLGGTQKKLSPPVVFPETLYFLLQ